MEKHKQLLDKEYEQLLTQFSKVDMMNLDQQIYFSIIIIIKEGNISEESNYLVAHR